MSKALFSHLESPRIVLRQFRDADLPSFLAYRNDPEVARYQSWESLNKQDAHTFVQEQKTLQPGVPGRWFQLAIELKETGQLVGDCGLKVHQQDTQQAEIGFTLSRDYQSKGLASETVCCLLDYAFIHLGLHRIIAVTDCQNAPCVALLERLGLRREGHFLQNVWFKGMWGDEYLYAILKDEWLQKRDEQSHK
jgi:RimJ/RimL family protein N-acetyltransferase